MIIYLQKYLWPFVLLAAGIGGMLAMGAMEQEVPRAEHSVPHLNVRVMEARLGPLTVTLKGYGQAEILKSVPISSEVKGRLVHVNPKLEPGETLSKGDLLFQIDETRYQNAVQEQLADRERLENRIKALKIQHPIDLARYKIAKRNQDLALSEYLRITRLFQKQLGSKTQLEAAEQALNRAKDLAVDLSGTVQGFPFILNQEKSSLKQRLARLASAREDLRQCRIYAPFDCRVKTASIESGQYVIPGQDLAVLADETTLELKVNLDSQDARQWLLTKSKPGKTWFAGLKQTDCRVFWIDNDTGLGQRGRVHRIVELNPQTRSLVVAVRIHKDRAQGFPITDGMFCRVEIPGRTRENIFCLPASALGADGTVFLADQDRVKKVLVEVVRMEKDHVFVGAGLTPGDQVILTPLAPAFEHSPLTIIIEKGKKQ